MKCCYLRSLSNNQRPTSLSWIKSSSSAGDLMCYFLYGKNIHLYIHVYFETCISERERHQFTIQCQLQLSSQRYRSSKNTEDNRSKVVDYLVTRSAHHGWEDGPWRIISGESSLAHAGAVVHDQRAKFIRFECRHDAFVLWVYQENLKYSPAHKIKKNHHYFLEIKPNERTFTYRFVNKKV